jgi:hypothetical protein
MKEEAVEGCTRRLIIINDENYDLTVGALFAHVTVPREILAIFRLGRKVLI